LIPLFKLNNQYKLKDNNIYLKEVYIDKFRGITYIYNVENSEENKEVSEYELSIENKPNSTTKDYSDLKLFNLNINEEYNPFTNNSFTTVLVNILINKDNKEETYINNYSLKDIVFKIKDKLCRIKMNFYEYDIETRINKTNELINETKQLEEESKNKLLNKNMIKILEERILSNQKNILKKEKEIVKIQEDIYKLKTIFENKKGIFEKIYRYK